MSESSTTLSVRTVLDAVPLPVVLLDRGLVVAHVNAAAQRLLAPGVRAGRSLHDLVASDTRADGHRVLRLRPEAAAAAVPLRLVLRDAGPAALAVVESEAASPRPAGGAPTRLPHARPPVRPAGGAVPSPAAPVRVPTAATAAGAVPSPGTSPAPPQSAAAARRWLPLARLADGRPVGVESLLPAGPAGSPTAPRPLQEACHAAADWHRRLPGAALQVLVALPAREVLRPGLTATVREALQVADCPPGALLLDVTEAVTAGDDDRTAAALDSLAGLGVGLAVDHLGTGSPSLHYLSRVRVGVLRLARSLVTGVEHDRQARDLVASLVAAARYSGAVCLAGGVDTPGRLAALRALGCDLGQGTALGPPLALEAVPGWLGRALQPPAPAGPAVTADPQTVARALALQDEGASLHTIAARLNLEGRRTGRGRRWHHTTVAQLLAACAESARRPAPEG